jgi:PQQ-dependent catabolism-associated CXXCW motif protein
MTKTTSQNTGKRVLLFSACAALIGIVMGVASYAKARGDLELFDPKTGYRLTAYRAAAPAAIEGGKLINVDALEILIEKEKPLLIDVMYFDHGLLSRVSFGLLGPNQNRMNIPDSVWLPKFGQGKLTDAEILNFKNTLAKLSEGDLNKPMVYYCLSDCWVSWNASRRAIEMGYKRVYWFKDGTDVWNDAGLKLVPAVGYEDRLSALSQKK